MASRSHIISSGTPDYSVGLGARRRLAVSVILAGVAATSATAQFNGEFTAWGNDSFGQCQLPTSVQLSSVAGGNLHSLGLTADGLVVAWGANSTGQCNVPAGVSDAVQVAAGGWYQTNDQRAHSMALLRNRTVVAWGSNDYGQCDVPAGLSSVRQIACGWAHSAALLTDGSVVMWGAGQSNDSNYQGANWGQRKIPSDLGFIEAISTKGCHMVALRGDGTIKCWGRSDQGQCAAPGGTFVQISAGSDHAIALRSDGAVMCWGYNYHGQTIVPSGLGEVREVAASLYGSLAVRVDGQVVQWGLIASAPTGMASTDRLVVGGYHAISLAPRDCNGDGRLDRLQTRNGELADYNSNDLPDCCETGASCTVGAYPVEWRVEDGGNGHWYQRRTFGGSEVSFRAAFADADASGGYLASVLSAEENEFIRGINRNQFRSYWLGAVQSSPSCSGTGCNWEWLSGEPWTYEAWCCGGFDTDVTGDEDCLASSQDGLWNSVPRQGGPGMQHYMVEWSADCDSDGIVDFGQILSGQLPDANGNGVADGCELLRVPEEFATIQAAVDAAQAGTLVLVSPGSYAPFDFKGKRIEVRSSAGAGSTTIDATGYAGSAVTFGSMATFATTLRGFTILTGSGTVFPNNPDGWRAGGGCYLWSAADSIFGCAGTIEDCAFIGATAGCGYGAGIWTRFGNVSVRRCRFDGLQAQHHGPAISLDPTWLHAVPTDPSHACVVEDCYIGHSSSYNNGGMLLGINSPAVPISCRVSRCEFEGNSGALQAGALLAGAGSSSAGGQLLVERCVFYGNSAPVSNAIASQYLGGSTAFTLRLVDSLVAEPAVSVRIGTGAAQLQGDQICGGQGAVQGAWSDLGGNQWSCFAPSDCDGDGRVDQHEIVLGMDSDLDGNGVIDSCEIYEVPEDYSTIQAAIDAVPAGQYGLVLVAAGTRNEAFALNGKNVLVRGAPGQATILDGAGLATSIARFTGDEPATAGVESLVFRAGTSGSLIYPEASFNVGGAIYGINSAASIRNCRFESCASDFGGAVYLIYSRPTVANCVFDDNTAINEGGGLFLYECTSTVSGCSFTNNDASIKSAGAASAFKAVGARATGEVVELNSCTFSGNRGLLSGSAIEYYENVQSNPGVLRISGCTITANVSGITVPEGAAGLRVLGRSASCVITGGTSICSNSPRDTSGPFLIEGSASVCGCFADITGDGLVNGGDLGALLGAWGIAAPTGVGDVNHDGIVDAQDLGVLLSSWGACPN